MHEISTINVTGPDAFEFLQGQLSNDLRNLDDGAEIAAAWCNPKGRVIWFGRLRKTADGYALAAPIATAESIVKRLTLFRFRAKTDFAIVAGTPLDPLDEIARGHAFIDTEQSEQFTPHMLNLDLLDAISFDKGCYTGQEIVARTHYKGATKRRTLRFRSDAAVNVGDKIKCAERQIGQVLNVAGNELLAVVAVDKATEDLTAGDAHLTQLPLPYVIVAED